MAIQRYIVDGWDAEAYPDDDGQWCRHSEASERIQSLERALGDVLKVFTGEEELVTEERIETWRAVLEGA